MIMGIPPLWKEEHLRAGLESTGDKDFLLNKLSWNVGEMRTSTLRVHSPKASMWFGKVFHSKEGRCLMVISSAEEGDRKQRCLTTRPNPK